VDAGEQCFVFVVCMPGMPMCSTAAKGERRKGIKLWGWRMLGGAGASLGQHEPDGMALMASSQAGTIIMLGSVGE
jgi:hypothetical protein